jgi:hypothetical protein
MSTMYEILNNQGVKVGTAHAMILPDGSIGASGKLDPKSLLVGRDIHIIDPSLT